MPGKVIAISDVTSNEKPTAATTDIMHASADPGAPRSGKGTPDTPTNAHQDADTSKAMVNGATTIQADSLASKTDPSKSSLELPSEIEHVTVNFYPLSQLIERVSQECYTDLQDMITKLASPSAGAPINGGDVTQAAGSERKLRWLEFANKHRERFIKLLVMLNWSRNVQDISKMIDLKVWMNQQEQMFNDTESWLGALRRDIQSVGLPGPDVPRALQVMKHGDLRQYSTLSYIPTVPLTAKEVSAVLQRINTNLHVRLNVHEDIPPALRDFSISSGRVTFRVAGKFELDLSIADEDPATQFYFIDFRFLFPTRSEIPAGQFRSQVESRTNQILADEGLAGCFAFFNDYVLTHQTNLFRRQALDLARGAWAGTIRVETLRRSLVVQYWVDRPEPKSWIEIGIACDRNVTGKTPHSSHKSDLIWKWFRNGKEVRHAPLLPLDAPDMHLEKILKNAIALHSTSILCSIKKGLEQSATADASSRLKLECSDREPANCTLRMSVGLPSTVLLQLEPTTGSFSIAPSTSLAKSFEAKLNSSRNPSKDGARIIMSFFSISNDFELSNFAQRSGWGALSVVRPSVAAIEKVFQDKDVNLGFYRPWPKTNRVLAATWHTGYGGIDWWVAEIDERNPRRTIAVLDSFILLHSSDNLFTPELSSLLVRKAAAKISYDILSRCLRASKVSHSFGNVLPSSTSFKPALVIDAAVLLYGARAADRSKKPHAESHLRSNMIFLTEHGLSQNEPSGANVPARVVYQAKGRLDGIHSLSTLLASGHPDIRIDKGGYFAMLFECDLASENVIETLKARLLGVERLRSTASILQKHNCQILEIALDRVRFAYAGTSAAERASNTDTQQLTCTIEFDDTTRPPSFTLGPHNQNPHQCIQGYLLKAFKSATAQGSFTVSIRALVQALKLTLPIVQAFVSIKQQSDGSGQYVTLLYRDLNHYRLAYCKPDVAFDLLCVRRGLDTRWQISIHYYEKQSTDRTPLGQALEEFFLRQDPERVDFKDGSLIEMHSAHRVLLELHSLVAGFARKDDAVRSAPETSKQVAEPQAAGMAPGSEKPASQSKSKGSSNGVTAGENTSTAANPQALQNKQAAPPNNDKSYAPSASTNQISRSTTSNTTNRTNASSRPGGPSTAAHKPPLRGGNGQSQNQNQNQSRSKGPEIVVLE